MSFINDVIVPMTPIVLLLWVIFTFPTPNIDKLIARLLGTQKEDQQ